MYRLIFLIFAASVIGLASEQDPRQTILKLSETASRQPDNPEILIDLGIAFGELEQWDQAIAVLSRAADMAPTSVRAHYNLGVTLDRARPGKDLGNPHYKKALELKPEDVPSLINLASNVADQNSEEARKLLDKAIKLDPRNPKAQFNLGLLLRNPGQRPSAIEALQKAIELDSGFTEARRWLSQLLVSEERWDEAVEQYREILTRDPNDRDSRYSLGQALIRKGNVEEGRRELEKSQQLRVAQQKQEELQRLLARTGGNIQKGQFSEAVKTADSAVKLDGSSGEARMYLGLALAAAGDPQSGLQELEKAVQLDPSNAEVRHNLGTVLLQLGREAEARQALEKTLELDPYFPESHNNLGLILSRNNQIEKAVEHFRMASTLNPRYLEALFNLGLAQRAMKRLDDAVATFRRAAAVAPNNAQVHYALGTILQEKGDLASAREAFDRARALQSASGSRPQ